MMISTLGQLGATLLAAGQKQSPSQRAQYLSQLGGIGSGAQNDVYKARQGALMSAQMQEKMREMEQSKALSTWASNPENLSKLGVSPEQFSVLGVPGLRAIMQAQATRDPNQMALTQAALAEKQREVGQYNAAVSAIEGANLTPEQKAAALSNPGEWVKTQIKPKKMYRDPEPVLSATGQPIIDANGRPLMQQLNIETNRMEPISSGTGPIQPPAETEEQKVLGKARGEAQTELRTAAAKAPDNISRLNLLGELTAGVKTGATADVQARIIGLAKAAGVSDQTITKIGGDPNLPATSEAITKVVNELTIGLIGPGGFPANSFSNADRDFLEKIFPNIRNQPEANQIAIEVLKRTELRKAQKQAEWRAYTTRMKAEGKKAAFDDFEDEYIEKLNAEEKAGSTLFSGLAEVARPFAEKKKPGIIDFGDLK
jgi:hypothetical protein